MNSLTYPEQIEKAYNKARKDKDVEAMAYYSDKEGTCACTSFEKFKGSWAYEVWIKNPETKALIQGFRFLVV